LSINRPRAKKLKNTFFISNKKPLHQPAEGAFAFFADIGKHRRAQKDFSVKMETITFRF
jgi:hypothetical protein